MKTIGWSAAGALLLGLLAYGAVRWLWPEIAAARFSNLIGGAAVVGAALGAWWGRRQARNSAQENPDA